MDGNGVIARVEKNERGPSGALIECCGLKQNWKEQEERGEEGVTAADEEAFGEASGKTKHQCVGAQKRQTSFSNVCK